MKIDIDELGNRTQTADEGCYLKQDETFVKAVCLPEGVEPWAEVPENELPGTETIDVEAEIIP